MTAEARELYVYTTEHFENSIERISPNCVAPLVAVRQVVRKAIEQYVKDYCTPNDTPFTQEDFETVSRQIITELK